MMPSTYLEYEVTLLLAKYGKNAVLNALATKLELSHEQLDSLLEMPIKKRLERARMTLTAEEIVEQIVRTHPTKATHLRKLYSRFQNRTFLPELRDVRRFFEQHSQSRGASKSRAESVGRLFNLLAELDVQELDLLCHMEPETGRSSLGVIADEILQRGKSSANPVS